MREIKFRAWVTNRDGVTYFNGNHMEYNVTIVDGKYADVESGWDIHGTYPYHLMQFTGLKDRNGVEIYEGDILKVDWNDNRYPIHNIGPVKWDERNACWQLGEGGTAKDDAETHMEVIGNTYEKYKETV